MFLSVIDIFACFYPVMSLLLSACLCLSKLVMLVCPTLGLGFWILSAQFCILSLTNLKRCCVAGRLGVSNAEGYCFVTGSLRFLASGFAVVAS